MFSRLRSNRTVCLSWKSLLIRSMNRYESPSRWIPVNLGVPFFFLLFLLPSLPLLSVIETPQRAQKRFRRVQCPARESVSNFRNSGFTNLLLIPRWKHVNFIRFAKEGRHSRGQGGWTDSALDRLIKGKLETLINLCKKSFKISLKSSQLHASL